MNLIKIGTYIAGKRKALGLTQKQLAEQLGMSDKSVSKWERGICLPDVSVYMELCNILGISVNEFLAGEDISPENIKEKSDDNLIEITKAGKHQAQNLKSVIAILIAITLVSISILGIRVYHQITQPRNYITALDPDSTEMQTARLLSGIVGAFLFRYASDTDFTSFHLYLSEYHSGELVSKEEICSLDYEGLLSPKKGIIVLIPNFETQSIQLIVSDDSGKYTTEFPILKGADAEYIGRSPVSLQDKASIRYNTEQGLFALHCGEEVVEALPVATIEDGYVSPRNQYTYYISFTFQQ